MQTTDHNQQGLVFEHSGRALYRISKRKSNIVPKFLIITSDHGGRLSIRPRNVQVTQKMYEFCETRGGGKSECFILSAWFKDAYFIVINWVRWKVWESHEVVKLFGRWNLSSPQLKNASRCCKLEAGSSTDEHLYPVMTPLILGLLPLTHRHRHHVKGGGWINACCSLLLRWGIKQESFYTIHSQSLMNN